MDVERGDCHAQASARATARLLEIGTARFLQPLDRPGRIGQADLGELRLDIAPAALEHAEHVTGRDHMPGRQRVQLRQRAARFFSVGQLAGRIARRHDLGRLAVARICFAKDVILERHQAIIVSRAAPQHRAGRHDRTLRSLDGGKVAGATRLARDAVVGRIDEAHKFGRFLIQQRVGPLGVGR